MSLKTFVVQIEDGMLDALKAAGTVLENFILGETQKLVAEVKASDLGTTALNIISALESHTGTGEEKFEMLVAAVVPALTKLVAGGGLAGLATTVEDFAIEFAQSAYNDFKANVLSKIATAV